MNVTRFGLDEVSDVSLRLSDTVREEEKVPIIADILCIIAGEGEP